MTVPTTTRLTRADCEAMDAADPLGRFRAEFALPEGVIYLVTGAGGAGLYNPEQQDKPETWQGFTDRFVSRIHSITVADVEGKTLTVRQVSAEGEEVDRFVTAEPAVLDRIGGRGSSEEPISDRG